MDSHKYLDKEHEMGVIWETDFIYAITRRDSKYAQIKIIKSSGMIPKVELTAFARHWLDLQGYDVTRREPELLPCPFCGGKAHAFTPMGKTWISMRCQRCEMITAPYENKIQAIRAWNRRAEG